MSHIKTCTVGSVSYSSQIFPFFIAAIVYMYALVPSRLRSAVLWLASFVWYWTWGPEWCVALFSLTAVNYLVLRFAKRFLFYLLIADVLIFLGLKAFPYFSYGIQGPYGISFYFLSLLGFLIDRKRAGTEESPGFFEFLAVPAFFPALLSGPVLRSRHYIQFSTLLGISVCRLVDGGLIFFFGFFKQQMLGKPLLLLTTKMFAQNGAESPVFWVAGFIATLTAYIEFSGFCDMGRGVAKCFGINLEVNFKPFYYAKSPVDFWARWNISLGEWIRDYFSFPLMLAWGKKLGQPTVLILSFIVVGLWHGLALNWLLFGIFNGFLVWLYYKNPRHVFFGRFLAWLLIVGNGVLTQKGFFKLFGGIGRRWTPTAEINWNYLFVCILLLLAIEYFQERKNNADFYLALPKQLKAAMLICLVSVFLWQIAEMNVDGKFLPPVYFRF